jgi:hypothetical protein
MDVKPYLSKGTEILIKVAAVVGGLTAIAGGYAYYLNNIWVPKVEVVSVDFDNAKAEVLVGKRRIFIYGDATFSVTKIGDWGIRFGSSKGINKYDRLELVKRLLVVQYIKNNEL